ncbi:hypothetical protein FRC10_004102 [Ceratobasidium sp. 414]|nr:hypothetical protein FRC10_004102 [Ceratobasidium sp. 414]
MEPHDDYIGVSGYRARSLTDLMKKTFSSNDLNEDFHYVPFEHCWKPPGTSGPAQKLMGEMYTSPVMIKAHREVQNLNIDCDLPRCVAGFMFASDGMQFAQFSHVKGWPILCSFGNLPDEVNEQITKMHKKPPTDALITHLRCELMHAVWVALLDDEFIEAWRTGVVIDCADGVRRRVFPRILTYSADYPEKVLLATIRNGGACFCPRCLVQKTSASQMGTPTDMRTRNKRRIDSKRHRKQVEHARQLIYDQGKGVQSKAVEDLLKAESYVPTMNAFSDRLAEFKFDIFSTLVVDHLHEVELGVWKALFQHLIRLLHRSGAEAWAEFNRRFRSVPTFGSTIRMFAEDVADMGRIAARDFEDILQGLLPKECDQPAQTLLFLFAEWHGLAKLRLHTTASIKVFKSITTKLGITLRNFAKLTEGMEVRETPKEYACRKKQAESNKASSMTRRTRTTANTTHASASKAQPQKNSDGDGRQIRTLNLNTVKLHSFGDYPASVEEYGTTDSYSTQIGELQNRKYKAQYMRTNKRNAIEQMTEIDDIMTMLQDIEKELNESLEAQPAINSGAINSLVFGQPYHIGQKERSEDLIPNISLWIANQAHDRAFKVVLLATFWFVLTFTFLTPSFVDRDMLMRYVGGGVGHYRQSNERATTDVDEAPDTTPWDPRRDDDARAHKDNNPDEDEAGTELPGLLGEGREHEAEDASEDEDANEDRGTDEDEADEDEETDGDEDEEDLEGDYDDEGADMGELNDVEDDDLHGF